MKWKGGLGGVKRGLMDLYTVLFASLEVLNRAKFGSKTGQKHRNGQKRPKWNNFLGPHLPIFKPTFPNFSKHLGKIG